MASETRTYTALQHTTEYMMESFDIVRRVESCLIGFGLGRWADDENAQKLLRRVYNVEVTSADEHWKRVEHFRNDLIKLLDDHKVQN